jgi:hypothetical protein
MGGVWRKCIVWMQGGFTHLRSPLDRSLLRSTTLSTASRKEGLELHGVSGLAGNCRVWMQGGLTHPAIASLGDLSPAGRKEG